MEPETLPLSDTVQSLAQTLLDHAETFTNSLLRPWNAYQVVIALAIFVLAQILAKLLAQRLNDWLRTREGWPKWRMRFAVMIRRRMRLILFVLMIWPIVWIMRELTWPSRSYLLGIMAQLALAWL
ncbi:MAG: mechanosensitive ion channel family protein, partial [Rhodobacteraceae bacterium]|nr:mechanosensitive ion channel family protein [Paracoccaceae bacterium]